jgi:hypothetical protein
MKSGFVAALLVILAGLGQAAPTNFPKDVSDFLSRRESCDHWRSEAAYDDERAADIAWSSCQACQGTDAQLARLKKKYRTNAKIMEELDALDSRIEPDDKAAAKEFCRNTRKPKWLK